MFRWLTLLTPTAILIGLLLVPPTGVPGAGAADPEFLEGQLLIAAPEMPDPTFREAVIYMIQHDAGGAVGLIVNKPLGRLKVKNLFKHFNLVLPETGEATEGEVLSHAGGPVERGVVFILHSDDHQSPETTSLAGGLALTTHPQLLAAIAAGTGPARSIFALGYSGWAPGQLEAEIARGGWVTARLDLALVFDTPNEKKWAAALALFEIEL